MDLQVGDKIAHPTHGAGLIRARRPITYNGSVRDVYVIEFPTLRIEMYVPVNEDEKLSLRPIAVADELKVLVAILESVPHPLPLRRRERRARLEARLNAASITCLAEIVRDWSALIRARPSVSVKDYEALDQARKLLSSEWALAANISFDEARSQINRTLNAASSPNNRRTSSEMSGADP